MPRKAFAEQAGLNEDVAQRRYHISGAESAALRGSVEQVWNDFFGGIRQLFIEAASPFVALSRMAGFELTPAQVWMLFFTLLFVGYAVHFLYGDVVLSRRGRRAVGTVVGIDPGDEGPDRPKIEFRDQSGRVVVFTSHLGVNATTAKIGAKVDIVFDPLHPKRAREVGRPVAKAYHLVIVAVFIGFMILATVMTKNAIY